MARKNTARDGPSAELTEMPFTISDNQPRANGQPSNLEPTFDASNMPTRPRLVLNLDDDFYRVHDDQSALVELDSPPRARRGVGSGSDSSPPGGGGSTESEPPSPYHCHVPRTVPSNAARNQLIAVSLVCLCFMIIEIIGGILSNSLALISDASHLGSDLAGFLVSLFAIYMAKKPPTKRLSLGYYRAEVLGAMVSILIIWVVTGILVYLAIQRVIHQNYTIHADNMLITAGLGVAFNIIMGAILHSGICSCQPHSSFGHSHGGHGHSHGHSHHGYQDQATSNHVNHMMSDGHAEMQSPCVETVPKQPGRGRKPLEKRNINVRAALIHVIGDLVQSVGVLIAAYIIKYKPEYKLADPICTFIFSVLVLFTTLTVLKDAVMVIMEAVPNKFDYLGLVKSLNDLPGVMGVHSLHVWCLTLERNAVAVHLVIDDETHYEDALERATVMIRQKFDINITTIQVERYNEETAGLCEECNRLVGLQQS